jgi:hypothetical protein
MPFVSQTGSSATPAQLHATQRPPSHFSFEPQSPCAAHVTVASLHAHVGHPIASSRKPAGHCVGLHVRTAQYGRTRPHPAPAQVAVNVKSAAMLFGSRPTKRRYEPGPVDVVAQLSVTVPRPNALSTVAPNCPDDRRGP